MMNLKNSLKAFFYLLIMLDFAHADDSLILTNIPGDSSQSQTTSQPGARVEDGGTAPSERVSCENDTKLSVKALLSYASENDIKRVIEYNPDKNTIGLKKPLAITKECAKKGFYYDLGFDPVIDSAGKKHLAVRVRYVNDGTIKREQEDEKKELTPAELANKEKEEFAKCIQKQDTVQYQNVQMKEVIMDGLGDQHQILYANPFHSSDNDMAVKFDGPNTCSRFLVLKDSANNNLVYRSKEKQEVDSWVATCQNGSLEEILNLYNEIEDNQNYALIKDIIHEALTSSTLEELEAEVKSYVGDRRGNPEDLMDYDTKKLEKIISVINEHILPKYIDRMKKIVDPDKKEKLQEMVRQLKRLMGTDVLSSTLVARLERGGHFDLAEKVNAAYQAIRAIDSEVRRNRSNNPNVLSLLSSAKRITERQVADYDKKRPQKETTFDARYRGGIYSEDYRERATSAETSITHLNRRLQSEYEQLQKACRISVMPSCRRAYERFYGSRDRSGNFTPGIVQQVQARQQRFTQQAQRYRGIATHYAGLEYSYDAREARQHGFDNVEEYRAWLRGDQSYGDIDYWGDEHFSFADPMTQYPQGMQQPNWQTPQFQQQFNPGSQFQPQGQSQWPPTSQPWLGQQGNMFQGQNPFSGNFQNPRQQQPGGQFQNTPMFNPNQSWNNNFFNN